jgi:hypothetical protein
MLAFLAPHALLPTGRGALPRMSATEDRAAAKASLFSSISSFDEVRSRGGVNIDFGVKGGELDKDTRAPTNLADGGFYAVSEELGKAADDVLARVDELFPLNPTPDPTRFLGTNEGEKCPLHGCWSNIFTTAADATFSKDSERGDAKVGNEVDGRTGRVWNCIDFIAPEGATAPANPEQLRVQLAVRAVSPVRVALAFRLIKVRLTKFFFFPLFGRRLTLTLPVPGPFITRLLTFFSKKEVPQAYFDVLYLDDELRVHKTGQGAIFVQRRPQWGVQA